MEIPIFLTGKVYEAQGEPENKLVVVKKAHISKRIIFPMLRHEACVLVLLAGLKAIPRVYAWGRSQYFEYLVIDRLGSSLADSVEMHRPLDLRSVSSLLVQMVPNINQNCMPLPTFFYSFPYSITCILGA
jgi:hypothetical protein